MINEFRQDPVTGDWVLFSSKRGSRPGATEERSPDFYKPKEQCPFEGDFKDQEETLLLMDHGKKVPLDSSDWTVRVIKNKYPAVQPGVCSPVRQEGLFVIGPGTGEHELVITRDHERHLADLSVTETEEVIRAYLERFKKISQDECSAYISLFHNQGKLAGATVYHSHSQIISMPTVPSIIERSVIRAKDYFSKNNSYIYDSLLEFEKVRMIFENNSFFIFCPFASRTAFEIRIFPKQHQQSFIQMSEPEIPKLAEALSVALKKLNQAQNKPDFIFFLRTAPLKDGADPYRWHIEIMPRKSVAAGLELGSDVYLNAVDPDEAAAALRAAAI